MKETLENGDQNRCWYCGKPLSDDKSNNNVMLYYETGRTSTTVHYKTALLSVPRCENCKNSHEKGGALFKVLWVIMILLWVVGTIAGFITDGQGMPFGLKGGAVLLIGFGLAGVLYLIQVQVKSNNAKTAGIKEEDDIDGYLPFETLKMEGWSQKQPSA